VHFQRIDHPYQDHFAARAQALHRAGEDRVGVGEVGDDDEARADRGFLGGACSEPVERRVLARFERGECSAERGRRAFGGAGADRGAARAGDEAPKRSAPSAAAQAASAASSAATTDLNALRVPKRIGARWSTRQYRSWPRSCSKSLVCARPVRAVTRQSMRRTSSPGE
jgi:hypothetical protein